MAIVEGVFLTGIGIILVSGVWLDFIATAMTASCTGVFSRRFSYGLYLIFKKGTKIFRSQRWHVAAGPFITLALIIFWFSLTWLGWSLIYLGSEESIINSNTRLPAQIYETVYFVGFALTTMGTGDFIPSGTLWQLVSVLTALNGLVLITLSITYAIPVFQAIADKRALSSQFAIWGDSVKSILTYIENDLNYKTFADHLKSAPAQILLTSQNHLAYPVLHYFHSPTTRASLALQIAVLDEVLRYLPDEAFKKQPKLYVLVPNTVKAITEFLATLSSVYIEAAQEEPPIGESANSENIAYRLTEQYSTIPISTRRRLLKALVEENGWSWKQLAP